MRSLSRVLCSAASVALGLVAGCGGDSTSPKQNNLSRTEARALANAVFAEIARAVGSPTPSSAATAATETSGPTFTASINAQCSAGGTISGSWTFHDDVNASGTGTKSGSVTVSASQCNISTPEHTFSTTGSYTFAFAASFTNNRLSSNFVWNADGNFTWTGGSCALDYSVIVTPQGQRSLTGTICGVSVEGSAG